MIKDNSIKVIYIAGNGHSGSTLLDIVLGTNRDCFSAGELTFITRDSIMEEYCSCNKKIPDCDLWSEIINKWNSTRNISLEEYKSLRNKYERNKTTLRTLVNKIRPSRKFQQYCEATLQLFQAIQEVTKCSVIVDSSKSPQRIAVLSRIVDIMVLHICRDFTGVMNSSKGEVLKNIKVGIETSHPPGRTWKVTINWIVTNIITEIFSLGIQTKKIFFRDFVKNPESLRDVDSHFKNIDREQAYSASHMLAGNVIRLKKNLKINPNIGYQYKKLNRLQKVYGKGIDKLFPFWS